MSTMIEGASFTEEEVARFWARVRKDGPTMPHMTTNCWTLGNSAGPNLFRAQGRMWPGARAALVVDGRPPGSLVACHRCDNRACVRPDHLWPDTQAANMQDMVLKGRSITRFTLEADRHNRTIDMKAMEKASPPVRTAYNPVFDNGWGPDAPLPLDEDRYGYVHPREWMWPASPVRSGQYVIDHALLDEVYGDPVAMGLAVPTPED